jgi:hypothetical protein
MIAAHPALRHRLTGHGLVWRKADRGSGKIFHELLLTRVSGNETDIILGVCIPKTYINAPTALSMHSFWN